MNEIDIKKKYANMYILEMIDYLKSDVENDLEQVSKDEKYEIASSYLKKMNESPFCYADINLYESLLDVIKKIDSDFLKLLAIENYVNLYSSHIQKNKELCKDLLTRYISLLKKDVNKKYVDILSSCNCIVNLILGIEFDYFDILHSETIDKKILIEIIILLNENHVDIQKIFSDELCKQALFLERGIERFEIIMPFLIVMNKHSFDSYDRIGCHVSEKWNSVTDIIRSDLWDDDKLVIYYENGILSANEVDIIKSTMEKIKLKSIEYQEKEKIYLDFVGNRDILELIFEY